MSLVSAVLFDLDGTLLNTAPDFETALNKLLGEEGQEPLAEGEIETMVSNGSAFLVSQAFNLSPEHARFAPLRQRLLDHYRACISDQTHFYPGMPELLAHLEKNNIAVGIVTNKPSLYTHLLFEQMGLSYASCVCPDMVAAPKPAPDGLLLACQQLKVRPAQCLFVGDHVRDVEAAKAANMRSVAASYGYIPHDEDVDDWQADFRIDTAQELIGIVDALNSHARVQEQ